MTSRLLLRTSQAGACQMFDRKGLGVSPGQQTDRHKRANQQHNEGP